MHTQFKITIWSIILLFVLSYVLPSLARILMVPAILYLLLLLFGLHIIEKKEYSNK